MISFKTYSKQQNESELDSDEYSLDEFVTVSSYSKKELDRSLTKFKKIKDRYRKLINTPLSNEFDVYYLGDTRGGFHEYIFTEKDTGEPIGSFEIEMPFGNTTRPKVVKPGVRIVTPHLSFIPKYQGRGLAKRTYLAFLKMKNYVFITDRHTKEAAILWNSLAKERDIVTFYYDKDTGKISKTEMDTGQDEVKFLGLKSDFNLPKEIAEQFDEACWVGYKQQGLKKKGDRMVPNCVAEENHLMDFRRYTQAAKNAKSKGDHDIAKDAEQKASKSAAHYTRVTGKKPTFNEENDTTEKKEMAETQLHFIKYAAEEILDYIKMGGEIEEWYQNKLSKVQSDVESLHSYVEGESRRTGMKEELSADEQFDLIEELVINFAAEHNLDPDAIWERFEDAELLEAAVDGKGHKSSTGGLTQKGRDYYNNKYGGNLKAPVTTKPSKLKAGSKAAGRRKSFCARMSGVDGPMKDDKGRPTRKALALRKWNC